MAQLMPYIWIGVIVFAAAAEIHTLSFAAVLFVPPALLTFAMSLAGARIWLQAAVFFTAAAILLALSRTVFRKFIKRRNTLANANSRPDAIIGKNAIVIHEINNYKNTGAIRINGFMWPAQAEEDGIIYESGLVVTIIAVNGENAVCTR
jgi:membrane protein implicated in regulation of membrane protease activity